MMKKNSGVPIRLMYYVDKSDLREITDFSNNFGNLISNSYEMAKNIAFENELHILKKALEIYNLNGDRYFSLKTEDEAIEEMRLQVILEKKYININEAKILKDQTYDFYDLTTDGIYDVYKFKSNNKYVYYKDYSSALEIYKNQISLISGVQQKNIITKEYAIIINGKIKVYKWTNETDLDVLTNQIYNDIYIK